MLSLLQNTSASDVQFTWVQYAIEFATTLLIYLLPATVSTVLWLRDEKRWIRQSGEVIELGERRPQPSERRAA